MRMLEIYPQQQRLVAVPQTVEEEDRDVQCRCAALLE